MSRFLGQFSCGAASAVAVKLTKARLKPDDTLEIVNAYLAREHADIRIGGSHD